jgi:ABC-type spermidine/putrescine transport system permease subunit II
MYVGLKHFHSSLPYLLFVAVLVVLALSLVGIFNQTAFDGKRKKSVLFAMILFHLQWTVGLILYFVSPLVKNIGDAMSDSTDRLYALEHPIMMTIALVLVTIARSKSKKTDDSSMNRTVFIFFILALACMIFCLPESWSALHIF